MEDFAKLLVTCRAHLSGVLGLREVPTRGSGVQVPELTKFWDETRELGGQERGEVESEIEDKLRDVVWGSEVRRFKGRKEMDK